MELVITEKPSVAQSIAQVIGARERGDGYLKGNGYIVSWCYGHLVELATPDAYDERYQRWSYNTLPIIPSDWKYEIKKDTRAQFKILKRLMLDGNVTAIVCATDAGREGELIFRLVYEQAGCTKPIKRLWISSMEENAIRDGFDHLRPGAEYDNLYASALCRQEADWLVGLNGTRLFTVLYKSKVLKVGRVQTPTLAMLVEREATISGFQKTPYYTVHLNANGLDAVSEKLSDKAKAENIVSMCKGREAQIRSVISEDKNMVQPRLYDLTSLQRDANRIFGFTAKKTLEYTQSLYEKKLCTYPRTDSQFLSDDMEDTARRVLAVIESTYSYLRDDRPRNVDIRRIMNSKKVSDHHAIIPTVQIENIHNIQLSEGEQKVLSLLATRVVTATADRYEYKSVKAEIVCEGQTFTASGKTVTNEGWKKYEAAFRNAQRVKADKEEGDDAKPLPYMSEGAYLADAVFSVIEGFTKPLAHFTEDSLLQAMEKAGASDTNDDAERKGLGTPATRADIIEKLVKDGFVKREKKQMIPTEDGKKLISILPDEIKSPKLTADWENTLTLIAKGEYPAQRFMDGIRNMVTELVKNNSTVREENKNMFGSGDALGKCPKCGGDVIKGKFGAYCSERCGMTVGKAMGKTLTDEQVKDLLEGKKIYLTELKSKKGGTYNAYLTADGIEDYSFTKDDGTDITGYRFKFKMEFPKREG
ncbi:MAG: DNA topoisomerase 3 [Lachnospiraceae bacterium]|nr:DNA topoisomerase 3 [Lachnospiraceae bacterium]